MNQKPHRFKITMWLFFACNANLVHQYLDLIDACSKLISKLFLPVLSKVCYDIGIWVIKALIKMANPLKYNRLATMFVGMTRFELATPRPPGVCATGLRYIPNLKTKIHSSITLFKAN
jgi:hypothetical protein